VVKSNNKDEIAKNNEVMEIAHARIKKIYQQNTDYDISNMQTIQI
jgi:hypothetical protein